MVVVGYDTRFLGERFAARVAQVLAGMDVRVRLSASVVTTPAVSHAAARSDCDLGVVITASHNPPEYSGYKLKGSFGGPAIPEQVTAVERELEAIAPGTIEVRPLQELVETGQVVRTGVGEAYLDELRDEIDIDAIKDADISIAYDAMYGAGQGILTDLLGSDHVVELHHASNPGFGGRPPEPIERNLPELPNVVVEQACDLGMATDGDGDRIGLYDEHGQFVDPHRILSLLVRYLYQYKNRRGRVIKTFTTTDMLDKLCRSYNLPLETTPVGFKHIAAKMLEGDVLVGGEESGGIAIGGAIPERDGIRIGLAIAEMMAQRRKSLSGLVTELFEAVGPHHYHRNDLHTSEEAKQAFLRRMEEGVDKVAGHTVRRMEDLDGFKFRMDDGWVMVRPSGTEPVLRIYSEAKSQRLARTLVQAMVDRLERYTAKG
jgi:phosphomannomutase